MNDDCQTPVDVARVKRHSNVVRAIEVHFSSIVMSFNVIQIPVLARFFLFFIKSLSVYLSVAL